MNYITFKHSFNSGDLISVLPGIKHVCEKNNTKAIIYQRLNLEADYGHSDFHPVKDGKGKQVCMNLNMYNMLKPLISNQAYVHSFEIWAGESVDFDFDKTRHNSQMPLPGGDIHKWPSLIYPQLECDLSTPWVDVADTQRHLVDKNGQIHAGCFSIGGNGYVDNVCDETFCIGQILINRTARYNNPYISYHFLKEYSNRIVFVGTKEEADSFCYQWGLGSPDHWNMIYRLSVSNFYKVAQAIKSCIFFIGNQSFCWHIADAMKVPRILEVCAQYPNTFPTGAEGYSFITQEALEFRFHKLLNETNVRTPKSDTGNS